MKRSLILGFLITLTLALVLSGQTHAQTGRYDLSWGSAVGGGAIDSVTAGGYTLGYTIGQANAAVATGGSYTLASGVWSIATTPANYRVFLPITLNAR
jgi:hypothetical protein